MPNTWRCAVRNHWKRKSCGVGNEPQKEREISRRKSRRERIERTAMVELKQKIINSLSKLSGRDTHQLVVEDLEKKIINSLSNDGVSMLLNCLYDAGNDSKPAVKKESLRLLAVL
ncbi:unnamed protein product [Fraxinus pennsylvanica]|uniref:TORTIFOLIA1/SINE1-2 N-terminal domain-containing protein n=1 Tax=Fraxinus pennsylvanica TaxID=56036 RepID=A0AAD1YWI2_9LAMI|nr:unnamed protein product [Fraxinus pennsylvanica]